MLVLHGSLHAGNLHIWLERPPAAGESSKPRRQKGASKWPRPWPFSPTAEEVATILGGLAFGAARQAPVQSATAWLPAAEGHAVASSALIAPPPAEDVPTTLEAWTLFSAALGFRQALAFLSACLDRPTLAPGVLVGPSLAFWTIALRYASVLVAREAILPGVEAKQGRYRAVWRPILNAAEAKRLTVLATAMPAACRALGGDAEAPPQSTPSTLLQEFLDGVVDEIVRAALQRPSTAAAPKFDSLHAQWIHALRSGDGLLRGSAEELQGLADQVKTWRAPLSVVASAPFRLCFRLEEPRNVPEHSAPGIKGSWRVKYLLQGTDDPSLLIPLEQVWRPSHAVRGLLNRSGFRAREYLLTSLGEAARLSPQIEASLKTAHPNGFATDTISAHRFLSETAWLLEQAGFGVLVPAWWTGKDTRHRLLLAVRATPAGKPNGGGFSLDQIVKLEWQVALGDNAMTIEELESLARLKTPLVRVRGQWVQVNASELQVAIEHLVKHADHQTSVRDLLQLKLGAGTDGEGLQIARVQAEGWLRDFFDQLDQAGKYAETPPPKGLKGTLRPYQLRGYSWLSYLTKWGLGACLADDMGLGKTIQTLALLAKAWENGERRPVLLVCPMSVVGNWKKEAERFTPDLPVVVHHGQKRAKDAGFLKSIRKQALVLTSFSLLHRDQALFEKVEWAGVVLDEAQNIKNPRTKQAQAACALKADYRLALTGTPVENHVGDLWSIWQFLNPGFLGNEASFRRRFYTPIHVLQDQRAAQQLRRLTGPFLLRRLKSDPTVIADLPDKLEMKVFCNLTREQVSLYKIVVDELSGQLEDTDGIQRKGHILAALSKLKQICNHPGQFLKDAKVIAGRSGKLARLTEMLEEVLDEGDRALIFTQFTEMGEILRRHLEETFGREVLFLHGGVNRKARDQMVARFQAKEVDEHTPRLFLLSLKAGGTGLNLTAANHVFHFDRWWNPAVENQATDRAYRIGQQRKVQVHKFVCVGTLEEKIDEMIERKQAVAGQVVGTGEAWLTEMSNTELKKLFELRDSALGE